MDRTGFRRSPDLEFLTQRRPSAPHSRLRTAAAGHKQTVMASQSQRVQWQLADLEAVDQHVTLSGSTLAKADGGIVHTAMPEPWVWQFYIGDKKKTVSICDRR